MSDENTNTTPEYVQVKMGSEKRARGFRLTVEGDGLKLRCDVDVSKFTPEMVAYVLREFATRVEAGPVTVIPIGERS